MGAEQKLQQAEENKTELQWRKGDCEAWRAHTHVSDKAAGGLEPGPVRFEEGRVVDDEGQEDRHCPQQKGRQELGNDWALERHSGKRLVITGSEPQN